MSKASDTATAERVQAALIANPAALKAFIENRKKPRAFRTPGKEGKDGFGVDDTTLLKKFGIELPHDYAIKIDDAGQPTVKHLGWWERNSDWALPIATIGTAGLASAFLPAAAAPTLLGPTGVAASVSPAIPASLAAVPTAASIPAATGAVTTAAAKAPSLWSKIAGPLTSTAIQGATQLVGQHMANQANSEASEAELAAQKEALDWQKEVYAQRQAQHAPYIQSGNEANTRLSELMGLPSGNPNRPPVTNAPTPGPAAPTAPATTAPTAPATPATAPAPQAVTMRTPSGRMIQVPPDKVEEAKQHGATPV